jgi:hypothetical protein
MSDIAISQAAVSTLLSGLPNDLLPTAPPTYLPIHLPLAFPTPLHNLNLIVLLHIVNNILLSPSLTSYFSETATRPTDIALRGLIGLYLASDESWGAANFLSTKYFNQGGLNEEKVVEFFGIEVMREKEHETMKGIRVGERWEEGAKVCDALVGVFDGLGKLEGRCVGEEILRIVDAGRIVEGDERTWSKLFARAFCERVSGLV